MIFNKTKYSPNKHTCGGQQQKEFFMQSLSIIWSTTKRLIKRLCCYVITTQGYVLH